MTASTTTLALCVLTLRALAVLRRPAVRVLASLAVIGLAVSAMAVVAVGWRWQLVPVLVGTILALAVALNVQRSPRHRSRTQRAQRRTLSGVAVGASSALLAGCGGLPAFVLPGPRGSYPVGTTVVEWVDDS